MSVRPLKNAKVTVPEELRVDAANETAGTAPGAGKKARAGKKTAARPQQQGQAAPSGQGKQLVRYKDADAEPKRKPKHKYGIDIDAQIRESSTDDRLFDAKNRFSKVESRIALSAFAFIVFALAASWMAWDKDYAIVGNADTAYNYGLVGGLMMLFILTYALRKRWRKMRNAGDIKYWYYFHFIFGVIGPVLIVLHTSFEIRSINAGFALFAMIAVVFSGFIGRYVYTRASYGLRSVEQDLQVVTRQLKSGVLATKYDSMAEVENQLRMFSKMSLSAPKSFFKLISRALFMKNKARLVYASATQKVASNLREVAIAEKWTKGKYRQVVLHEKKMIQAHLAAVAGIASARSFELLASKWRILHVPLLYLLTLSALAHVLAVHMY